MNKLESKIWYRALKVVYITILVLTLLLALGVASWWKPYQQIDQTNTKINCINPVPPGKLSFEEFRKMDKIAGLSRSIWVNNNGSLSFEDDVYVKKICAKETATSWIPDTAIPVDKNYIVEIRYETVNSWLGFFTALGIGLGGVWIIMEIIKRVFLYIVIGKKFFLI